MTLAHSSAEGGASIPGELEEKLAVARQALNDAAVAMLRGSGITVGDRLAVEEAWRASDPGKDAR